MRQLVSCLYFADYAVIRFKVVGELVWYVLGLLKKISKLVLCEWGECWVIGEMFDDLVVGDLVLFWNLTAHSNITIFIVIIDVRGIPINRTAEPAHFPPLCWGNMLDAQIVTAMHQNFHGLLQPPQFIRYSLVPNGNHDCWLYLPCV